MRELLPLKDQRWVDGAKITSIIDRVGSMKDEARIYLLREVSGIVRRLPEKIYESTDDRLRLAAAVQEAHDAAIADEGL